MLHHHHHSRQSRGRQEAKFDQPAQDGHTQPTHCNSKGDQPPLPTTSTWRLLSFQLVAQLQQHRVSRASAFNLPTFSPEAKTAHQLAASSSQLAAVALSARDHPASTTSSLSPSRPLAVKLQTSFLLGEGARQHVSPCIPQLTNRTTMQRSFSRIDLLVASLLTVDPTLVKIRPLALRPQLPRGFTSHQSFSPQETPTSGLVSPS